MHLKAENLSKNIAGKLIKSGTMEDVKGDESLEEVFLELADGDTNAESSN